MSKGKNQVMAEKAFQEFSNAFDKKTIDLHQCSNSKDMYVHADQPNGVFRFTYAILSEEKKAVMAIAIIHFSKRFEDDESKWSIGWYVHPDYRNKKLGQTITQLALEEFEKNMRIQLPSNFYIEAVVDAQNIASRKIAEKLIGNEEAVNNKESYSYLKKFKKS